jgi:K+-transporting ATPase A subunit
MRRARSPHPQSHALPALPDTTAVSVRRARMQGVRPSNRVLLPQENIIYRLDGINPAHGMDQESYDHAFLLSNLILGLQALPIFISTVSSSCSH